MPRSLSRREDDLERAVGRLQALPVARERADERLLRARLEGDEVLARLRARAEHDADAVAERVVDRRLAVRGLRVGGEDRVEHLERDPERRVGRARSGRREPRGGVAVGRVVLAPVPDGDGVRRRVVDARRGHDPSCERQALPQADRDATLLAVEVGGDDFERRRLARRGLRGAARADGDRARLTRRQRDARRVELELEPRRRVGGRHIEGVLVGQAHPRAEDVLAVLAVEHLPGLGAPRALEGELDLAVERIPQRDLDRALRGRAVRIVHRAADAHGVLRRLQAVGEVLVRLGHPVDGQRASGDLVVGLDLARLIDHDEGEVLELAGERMLVDRAAAGAEQQVRDAVARRQRLQRVVVAGDHVVDAVLREHRLHALLPAGRLVVPQRPVEQEDDGPVACRERGKRLVEPRELRIGESGLDASLAILGVEDHEARELEFDRVVQRSEHPAVLLCEAAVAAVAQPAHEVMVARRRVEGHAEPVGDAEEVLALADDMRGVARVALHEVAHAEHRVGLGPVDVAHGVLQVAQAPVAAGGAVGHDRHDLLARSRGLDDPLAVARRAGFVALEGRGGRRSRVRESGGGESQEDSRGEKNGVQHLPSVPRRQLARVKTGNTPVKKKVWSRMRLGRTKGQPTGFSLWRSTKSTPPREVESVAGSTACARSFQCCAWWSARWRNAGWYGVRTCHLSPLRPVRSVSDRTGFFFGVSAAVCEPKPRITAAAVAGARRRRSRPGGGSRGRPAPSGWWRA